MSKSNYFENAFLKLIFNAVTIADIARNATSPLTDLYVSLHTANPSEGGDQENNEVTYTGYARVAVPRDATGWTVTGNVVVPANPIIFPVGSGGSGLVKYWAVGTDATGPGNLLYFGTVAPFQETGLLITPRLTVATQISED